MFKGRQLLVLYRRFCALQLQQPNPSVTSLPISSQLPLFAQPHYLRWRTSSTRTSSTRTSSTWTSSTHDQLFHDISMSKKYGHLYEVLSGLENQEFKPSTPIQLTDELEAYIKLEYMEHLKNSDKLVMAILKFVCNHCESDSDLEKDLLKMTMEQMNLLSALELAEIVDCITFVNTDMKWTLVKAFVKEIEARLVSKKFRFTQAGKTLFNYENTFLEPYLIKHCILFIQYKDLNQTDAYSLASILGFLVKSREKYYILYNRIVLRQLSLNYKNVSYSVWHVSTFLYLTVKYEFMNIAYFRFLISHLIYSLNKPFDHTDKQAHVKDIISCLVSFAMAGFRDDELVEIMLRELEEQKSKLTNYDLMSIYCALSMLNWKDLSVCNNWGYNTLLSDAKIKEGRRAPGLCALVQQEKLNISEVEMVLKTFAEKTEWLFDSDHHLVRSFFTTKAYSELILNIPVSKFIDEERLVLQHPPIEALTSTLKESVVFVAKLLVEDESLLRCLYLNKYQHFIDVDFYVDDEGTIRPEDYDGPLTRILLIALNQTDLVICDSKKESYLINQHDKDDMREVHYEPRGLMNMFLHHLELAEKAEIITINFYEWNAMVDRHERKEFLEAAIKSKLQQKQAKATD